VCVQLVTPYRVTHLQRYEVKLRGNVTSVYPPLLSIYSVSIFRPLIILWTQVITDYSLRYSQEPPIPATSHVKQLHVPTPYSFQVLLNIITLPFHLGLGLLRSLFLLVLGPTLFSHPVSNYAKACRSFQKLSHCSKRKESSLNSKSCILQKTRFKWIVNIQEICKLLVQELHALSSTNTTQVSIQTVFGFETVSDKAKMFCSLIIK
jgi:hypothetical protein